MDSRVIPKPCWCSGCRNGVHSNGQSCRACAGRGEIYPGDWTEPCSAGLENSASSSDYPPRTGPSGNGPGYHEALKELRLWLGISGAGADVEEAWGAVKMALSDATGCGLQLIVCELASSPVNAAQQRYIQALGVLIGSLGPLREAIDRAFPDAWPQPVVRQWNSALAALSAELHSAQAR